MSECPIAVISMTFEFAPFDCRYIPAMCTKLIFAVACVGFFTTVQAAIPQAIIPEVSGCDTVPIPLSWYPITDEPSPVNSIASLVVESLIVNSALPHSSTVPAGIEM